MQVKLRLLSGRCEPGYRNLQAKFFLVGRHAECQIRPVDEGVSERHCMILVGKSHIRLRDLRSTTGTFLNGERITDDRVLTSGDQVQVGTTAFAVHFEAIPAEAVPPPASSVERGTAPVPPPLPHPPRSLPHPLPHRPGELTGEQVEAWLEEADHKVAEEQRHNLERLKMVLPAQDSSPQFEPVPVPPKRTPPKQPPGKLPPPRPFVAASSDEAATQVLQKLQQRAVRTGRP